MTSTLCSPQMVRSPCLVLFCNWSFHSTFVPVLVHDCVCFFLFLNGNVLFVSLSGLWDVLRNDEVGKMVSSAANRDFLNCAKYLCSEAMIAGSTDNITALVIDLRNRIVKAPDADYSNRTSTGVSTPITSYSTT